MPRGEPRSGHRATPVPSRVARGGRRRRVSGFGYQVNTLALPWLILETTGSATWCC
ncbi:hypothetical protein [Micromonospora sp. NPDC000442]|uniref:hypothetical protein n=1 Tax=Micromonospora sp. NPDC000442 TaxID=3364217 RepID=UPI00367758A9